MAINNCFIYGATRDRVTILQHKVLVICLFLCVDTGKKCWRQKMWSPLLFSFFMPFKRNGKRRNDKVLLC